MWGEYKGGGVSGVSIRGVSGVSIRGVSGVSIRGVSCCMWYVIGKWLSFRHVPFSDKINSTEVHHKVK